MPRIRTLTEVASLLDDLDDFFNMGRGSAMKRLEECVSLLETLQPLAGNEPTGQELEMYEQTVSRVYTTLLEVVNG